jgi:hypothetical protein
MENPIAVKCVSWETRVRVQEACKVAQAHLPMDGVLLASYFGRSSPWWSEDALERDMFLTAELAKDFGLIDKVIEKRPEEPSLKSEPALTKV